MKKVMNIFLFVSLILLFFALNYNFIDNKLQGFLIGNEIENAKAIRIVDGDTIEIENKTKIRFLGINTPEKGELYSQEAKEFLEKEILNKTIRLEKGKEDKDMYGRLLRYVFLDEKNINIEQVRNGFANPYIYDADEYTQSIRDAWEECINENKNLCEKSKDECADCIEIKDLNIKEQKVIFYNKCRFDCSLKDWTIKDEGRKKFIFPDFILKSNKEVSLIVENKTDTNNVLFWKRSDYVWTETGDTLFLKDEKGGLVLWESY